MNLIWRIPIHLSKIFVFLAYFLFEVLKSNFILMIEIVRINSRVHPAIVKLDLQSKTEREIALISSLITLTPGSLTLAIKSDPPTLFVHGMFVHDLEDFKKTLTKMETKMIKAMRLRVEK